MDTNNSLEIVLFFLPMFARQIPRDKIRFDSGADSAGEFNKVFNAEVKLL